MNTIDYPNLVLSALRHSIAGLLREVAAEGLPGEHHFYITFRTDAPGVEIPPSLQREFPDELTIVLQHQFWNFTADEEGFGVTLRFGGVRTDLRVPYAAMTAFADPSVEFGVQLAVPQAPLDVPEESPTEGEEASGPKAVPSGTVIAFDKNRKRD